MIRGLRRTLLIVFFIASSASECIAACFIACTTFHGTSVTITPPGGKPVTVNPLPTPNNPMPSISGPGVPSIGGLPIPLLPMAPPGLLTPQQIKVCISNIKQCPATILTQMTYANIQPIVNEYEGYLRNQAGNRWQGLDVDFIGLIQQFYSIDLHRIRYATGINTVHGMNMTLGNDIFFTGNMNPYNTDDAHLLFHEMEHSVQYVARGGIEPFLSEYLSKSIGQVIAKRSFSIHDYIDIENAAISKSNQVSQAIANMGWTFHFYNNCQYPIKVAVDYLDDSGQWNAMGYWDLDAKTDSS
jgi:hypothetical protein